MTPQTAKEIFELHTLQQREPSLRGVHGTYLFDIEGVGGWFVKVNDGAIEVENAMRDADCSIQCNEEDFVSIVLGRRNLVTAVLQGRVHVEGSFALAQKFHGLVRSIADWQRGIV